MGYWREHHKRAAKEARLALWDQSRKRTVIAILVWAVALGLVWLAGDPDDVRGEIILSIGFTAALGLVFPAVYAWEFVALIPKRASEAEALLQAAESKPPNLSKWLDLDPLPLEHIAFLWCGKPPRGSVLKAENDVRLQYEKLRRAILSAKLQAQWGKHEAAAFNIQRDLDMGTGSMVGEKTPVAVAELKRYALSVGEKPSFLFPDTPITPRPPKIEISTASGAPYELLELVGERRKSVVKIGIRNAGDGIASNCSVLIERLAPKLLHERAYPIKLNVPEFTLRHDDPEKFVEIAEYWTTVGKIRLNEPQGTTFTGPLTYFEAGIRYSIVVKIRAAECSRSAVFDMWVDPSNQLRLSYAGDCE